MSKRSPKLKKMNRCEQEVLDETMLKRKMKKKKMVMKKMHHSKPDEI
jgi:hypothetical protein